MSDNGISAFFIYIDRVKVSCQKGLIKMCNNMTKRISIRLNQADYDYLVNRAVDKDMPIAYLVRELIK